MHENFELEISAIRDIEEEIIYSFNTNRHYENDKYLLELRRRLINDMVLAHQEDIIEPLREFNDLLMEALKELYDRAKQICDDLKAHNDYGDEIDVTASSIWIEIIQNYILFRESIVRIYGRPFVMEDGMYSMMRDYHSSLDK